jgi:hypothetical protein
MHTRTTINLHTCPSPCFARSLRKRNPKPTGEIHHSLGIIQRSERPQFLQITAVEILHSRRFRKRRVDEVWEIFRQGTFFNDLYSERVQGLLHGFDPVLVILLVFPGEIYNDGAIRFAFLMRPGRVCRMVKHGRGERPQPNGDTSAIVLFKSFGSFARLLLNLIDDIWSELIDHNVTPPTTWKLTNAGHWRFGTILFRYVCGAGEP